MVGNKTDLQGGILTLVNAKCRPYVMEGFCCPIASPIPISPVYPDFIYQIKLGPPPSTHSFSLSWTSFSHPITTSPDDNLSRYLLCLPAHACCTHLAAAWSAWVAAV